MKATAKVRITLEVELSQPWSGEATIRDVHKQAAQEARERVMNILGAARQAGAVRVVGDPHVFGVITED